MLTVPAIVKIAKPMPRTTQIAYSPAPEPAQISAGAGAPSATMPSATTAEVDRRRSRAGTSGWQTTVAASITVVVAPADAVEVPREAIHAGSAANVT